MNEKNLEKFLHWLWKQGFASMVQDIGMDGVAKKYLKEQGENNSALTPISVSFIKRFQEIIYGDLSDSEALNELHKLDNER